MTKVRTPLHIISTGIYLPGEPISSSFLEQQNGLPEGWAKRYSGVEQRHWAGAESGTDMAVNALEAALEKAEMAYKDLDLLVSASATYDYPIPHNACLIQERLCKGDRLVPGFDIDATCLGLIVALDVCSRMLDGRRYKKIAIVCSEIASKSLNPNDWETLTLLGDAAVAIIIGYPEDAETSESGILAGDLTTYPHAARYNIVEAGGNCQPGHHFTGDATPYFFKMEGIKLLRLAMEKVPEFVTKFYEPVGMTLEATDYIVPHQASLAGLMLAQKALEVPLEKMMINLPRYGNTLSCSVGLALHELLESGRVKRGQTILMLGSGAGFSIGGVLLRY